LKTKHLATLTEAVFAVGLLLSLVGLVTVARFVWGVL
jgi:hypothetical protein